MEERATCSRASFSLDPVFISSSSVNMSGSLDLSVAKKNLSDALGDTMKLYLQLLMSWFKLKITRADFDHEARKLLSQDNVKLHNQFLLAMFAKCSSLGSSAVRDSNRSSTHTSPGKSHKKSVSSSKKRKAAPSGATTSSGSATSRNTFQYCFVPVNPLQQAIPVNLPAPEPEDKGLGFMTKEMTLPDIGMVHGRLIVCAWDFGLENVEDDAVRLLMYSVQVILKNILTVTLSRRNAYKLRDGRFRYGMGTAANQSSILQVQHRERADPGPLVSISGRGSQLPSMKPTVEQGMETAAILAAQENEPPPIKSCVSLYDLLDALQVHKSTIPSHTVYATNVERIIHKIWHPSSEELEQASVHLQDTIAKKQISYSAVVS